MFVPSADQRRNININCNITDYLGPSNLYPIRNVGNFKSSSIYVVSKPAKKQTLRAPDAPFFCLKSGSKVCLFHRSTVHRIPPRFLYVQNGNFVTNEARWDCVRIYSGKRLFNITLKFWNFIVNVEESARFGPSFVPREGFIHYGML